MQLALASSGALNAKAVRALLDVDAEKAEFAEDGSLKGLSDQIQKLQKAEDSKMLFKAADTKPVLKGFKPAEGKDGLPQGSDGQPKTMAEAIEMSLSAQQDTESAN